MDLLCILVAIVILMFAWISWSDANSKLNEINAAIQHNKEIIQVNKGIQDDITNKIKLNKNLVDIIDKIENTKFGNSSLFAEIYADQRKALVDLYKMRLENSAVKRETNFKKLANEIHTLANNAMDLKYKILKYEQLFPWIKNFENVDLSLATEEFYERNNLPACGWQLQENFKKEIMKAWSEIAETLRTKENKIKKENEDILQKNKQQLYSQITVEQERINYQKAIFEEDKTRLLENIENREKKLDKGWRELKKLQEKVENAETNVNKKTELLSYRIKDIPALASYIADEAILKDNLVEKQLRIKKNPAIKAAEELRHIKIEKKNWIQRCKEAEYKVLCYEQIVPWLVEIEDEKLGGKNQEVFNEDYDNKEDAAGYWLTKEEYLTLLPQEKYQKALDRYWQRHKSNAEIGRDYERYIGYQYETNGWDVEYRGIIDGYEDRGRDLICRKEGITYVVQCKYWSSKKEIHENHINQLFGTTVKYYLEQNPHSSFTEFSYAVLVWKTIIPQFVTSTKLSDTAKEFATALGIEVKENIKLNKYPMIKCNISTKDNERIYHLPFDQQYDKIKIDRDGEFFAMTVKEAEAAGFRRAKRWYSDLQNNA